LTLVGGNILRLGIRSLLLRITSVLQKLVVSGLSGLLTGSLLGGHLSVVRVGVHLLGFPSESRVSNVTVSNSPSNGHHVIGNYGVLNLRDVGTAIRHLIVRLESSEAQAGVANAALEALNVPSRVKSLDGFDRINGGVAALAR
jgi:hypothetical protein